MHTKHCKNNFRLVVKLKFLKQLKHFYAGILTTLLDIWKMAVAVPSRFACLKIEGDDFRPKKAAVKVTKKQSEVKSNVKTKKVEVKTVKPVKSNVSLKSNGSKEVRGLLNCSMYY